jgi:hypothetical protein
MVPGPNFGEFMSKDKFERWMRRASEGPKGATDKGPWGTPRWLAKGCNDNRKKTIKPSWLVAVDEATWAWTGQGVPHLPSVPREPEPLGAEIKNLCDGESGVMLHVKMQEGKVRMARKQRYDLHKATAAATVRLAHKGGLDEPNSREEGKVTRDARAGRGHDSWFASHETAAALLKELQVLFVGNVKTAMAKHPLQQPRHGGILQKRRGGTTLFTSFRAPTSLQLGGTIIISRRSSPRGGRQKAALKPKGSASTTMEPRSTST